MTVPAAFRMSIMNRKPLPYPLRNSPPHHAATCAPFPDSNRTAWTATGRLRK